MSKTFVEAIGQHYYRPRESAPAWSSVTITIHKHHAEIISEYAREHGILPRDVYRAIIAHAANELA